MKTIMWCNKNIEDREFTLWLRLELERMQKEKKSETSLLFPPHPIYQKTREENDYQIYIYVKKEKEKALMENVTFSSSNKDV